MNPRGSLRRRLRIWLGGFAVLFLLFHLAGGWFFAGEIYTSALEPDPATVDPDIRIAAVDGDTVTLATADGPDELSVPGVWGLEWATGYGQLRELIATGNDTATWRLEVLSGSTPQPDVLADLDPQAFPGDPERAHGLSFDNVSYVSELGENPAWFVPGGHTTWVLLVHGNGLTRRDVLRPLAPVAAAGYPALAITYRNHPKAPADPSGRLQYGLTEWRDVEAAVQHAVDAGAEDVVLVAYSMGGALVTHFLYESSLADRVVGVILDSPLLDLGAAVDLGARNRSLPVVGLPIPDTLTSTAKWVAGLRYDVDWGELDFLERVEELAVPILLFHGSEDDTVPVETSDELAELRPDIVTYHRVETAKHLQSWNLDPVAYEARLTEFLEQL